MRFSILLLITLLVGFNFSSAQSGMCNNPLGQKNTCLEMNYLRSQVFVLGAQRDLMQINYPLLEQVGREIQGITSRLKNSMNTPEHNTGLTEITTLAAGLENLAASKNTEALIVANNIQQKCLNCHNKSTNEDRRWESIFKNDWSAIYNRCNEPNRSPYTCKNMHGMLSSIGVFFTASNLNLENYEITSLCAAEIQRISTDLVDKKFLHGGELNLNSINRSALEIAQLADDRNPEAFNKAAIVTQQCMQCHSDRPTPFNFRLEKSSF